jgi:two-component system NarL family sensor kinase
VAHTRRVRRIATWLALAGSLGAAILFTAVRGLTPSDGARVAFYGDAWSAAGIRIAPIDEPAPGLQDGDTVVAVDGRPLEAWLRDAADPSVARPTAGTPTAYELTRAGQPLATDVTWTAPPIGQTLLDGWSVILFSAAFAALAAFVFARRPRVPAATALMLAACGAAGSSVPWFLGVTVSDVVRGGPFLLHAFVTGPLYMLLWPASLHLALVFPAAPPAVARRRWLIPLVYALGLGGYALAILVGLVASPTLLDWVGTWPTAQVLVVVPVLVLALGLFVRSYARPRDAASRAQMRWLTLGVVASAGIGLVVFWIPELVVGHPMVPASSIGLVALPLPLGIAAGILADDLFEMDVVVNRTLVYGGMTLGVVATYAVVASAIGLVVGQEHGFAISLLATGIAALAALPLRDLLQRSVNRLMYGQRDEPWRAMRRLGQRLELAADPDRAFPTIVETIAETLRLPYVALELVHETGGVAIAAEVGSRQPEVVTLPLAHGAEPVGRLVLGIRSGERGFRGDEQDLLEDLARQAGTAIHALRLRDDVARSHERLVFAREEERRRLRRDLHDGLGPTLAAIGLRAEASAEKLDSDPAAARRLLDELGQEVRAALADIRRLVDGLRPPALDELGLLGAIEQQAARLEGGGLATGTRIVVDRPASPLPELPAAVEVAAFRIAVEALTNVVRHSAARTCRVRIRAGDDLTIEVDDDGNGLPQSRRAGTGMESMEGRAAELGGTLAVVARPGGGVRVVARLPIRVAAGSVTP